MKCPKCDRELEREPADPSVGIEEGYWFCEACDLFVMDSEVDDESDFVEDEARAKFDI